MNIKGESS